MCHSGSGFCSGLITCLEESYQVCVIVCDLETLRGPRADFGFGAKKIAVPQEFLLVTVLEYWCGVVQMYKETGESMYVGLVCGTW